MHVQPLQFGAPYFPGGQGQGKLFRDPKPVDEHRFQRGYTPERMAAVQAAPILAQSARPDSKAFAGPAGGHRMKEVIARSTHPIGEVAPMFNGDQLRVVVGGQPRGSAGSYERRGGGLGTVHLSPWESERDASMTLMHEMGHMRSATVAENDSVDYDTPQRKGQEEAYADDHMVTHWRPDPRDVRRGGSTLPSSSYEHVEAWEGRTGFGKRGFKAYNEARTTPNQKALRNVKYKRQRANGHYQEPLDVAQRRDGGQGVFDTPTKWVTSE